MYGTKRVHVPLQRLVREFLRADRVAWCVVEKCLLVVDVSGLGKFAARTPRHDAAGVFFTPRFQIRESLMRVKCGGQSSFLTIEYRELFVHVGKKVVMGDRNYHICLRDARVMPCDLRDGEEYPLTPSAHLTAVA
jgi:hypothetical protein